MFGPRRAHRSTALAVTFAAVLALGACGGDGETRAPVVDSAVATGGDERTAITLTAEVPEGSRIAAVVPGAPAGAGSTPGPAAGSGRPSVVGAPKEAAAVTGHPVTWSPGPTVAVGVQELVAGTVTLDLRVTDFELVDLATPDVPVERQGHVLLTFDDDQTSTVFNPVVRISNMPPGEHRVRADLVAADSHPWLIDGKPVTATTTFTVTT